MAIKEPLVITDGIVKQLPAGDILKPTPESQTLTYNGNRLTLVTTASGTRTIAYSGSQITTVTDTISGTLSTYGYSGNRLVSITVTSL